MLTEKKEIKLVTCAIDAKNYALITHLKGHYGVVMERSTDKRKRKCRVYFREIAQAFDLFYTYCEELIPGITKGEGN
jgi:hypothetical protein